MGKALVVSTSLGLVIAVTPWSAALVGVRASQAARWFVGSRASREATVRATVRALLSSRGFIEGGFKACYQVLQMFGLLVLFRWRWGPDGVIVWC